MSFVGCGEGEESDAFLVDLYIHPNGPASVRKSDFTTIIDSDEFTVNGPWFFITISGFNSSPNPLFIATLEVICVDNLGIETNWTPILEEGVLGVAAADAESQLLWGPRTATEGNVSGAASMIGYVGDLSQAGDLRYRCEVIFEGWFLGEEDDPETDVDETTLPGKNFKKVLKVSAKYQD